MTGATIQPFTPIVRDPSDAEGIRSDLLHTPCCVVKVMEPEEANEHARKMLDLYWNVRPDVTRETSPYPAPPHGSNGCSFAPGAFGIPQQPEVWKVRFNRKLEEAYCSFYGCEYDEVGPGKTMAVSSDGVAYWDNASTKIPSSAKLNHADPVKAVSGHTNSSLIVHKDIGIATHGAIVEKNLNAPVKLVLQSQVLLLDSKEDDSGLVLATGDLDEYDSRPHFFNNLDSDHCGMTTEGYEYVRHRLVKVCAKKGEAILWPSRRPHTNKHAVREGLRLVVFICWVPRGVVPYDKNEKFLKILASKTGPHWPMENKRWRAGGSHMSNAKGLSKILPLFLSPDVQQEIWRRI